MLVDVVEMRYRGAKLSKDAIAAAVPKRGTLEIRMEPWRSTHSPNEKPTPTLLAFLVVEELEAKIRHELREPQVNRLEGDQMVIVGIEAVYDVKRNVSTDYPQAWWCRLVSAPAPADPG